MSDEEIKNEVKEEEKQIEEATVAEDTAPDTEKVQDVEQGTEEKPVVEAGEEDNKVDTTGSEAENKEAETTAGEHDEAGESEVEEGEKKKEEGEKQEEEKTAITEEASEKEEPTSEELKVQLEELKYDRAEEVALQEIGKAQAAAQSEIQKFQNHVTNILEQGLKHYGIDPDKTMEDLEKEDPAKADIARELLKSAQQHIQAKQQELIQKVGEMEQNVVFNRAEREIKKFKLTAEQEIEAAKMFVRIINTTGVADISEDLKEKVRLAVASAKMSVPIEEMVKIEKNSDANSPIGRTSDTSVSKTPSEKIEEKTEEKTEEKPETTPEVDIDDYKESPTDTAKTPVSTAPEINETNVLAKMAAMPYKDRVAFMIEHQDVVDAAMRKESARRERERRKI